VRGVTLIGVPCSRAAPTRVLTDGVSPRQIDRNAPLIGSLGKNVGNSALLFFRSYDYLI
jgi:hypothetical protein